jgi:hypothetical protein
MPASNTCRVSDDGLALRRGDALVVETGADWIEVRTPDGVLPAAGTVRVDVTGTDDVGPCAALHRVRLTVRNGGSRPIRVNLNPRVRARGARR